MGVLVGKALALTTSLELLSHSSERSLGGAALRAQQIREIFDPTKGMSLEILSNVAFIFPLFKRK